MLDANACVDKALAAIAEHDLTLPGQDTAASLAGDAAAHLLRLRQRIKDLDRTTEQTFAEHPQAAVIRSLPGMGPQQALIALARRRINVLWALLRDNRPFQPTPPVPATPSTS